MLLAALAGPLTAQGPDRGGYRWIDSDTTGGPAFNWLDISGSGTRLALGDDDNLGPLGVGFGFDFYGQVRESVRVCSNGWLSFSSASHQFHHFPIPDTRDPNALLAPLWADLDPAQAGAVCFLADSAAGRFIVSWIGVPVHGTGDSCTFQVVLDTGGAALFQYLRVPQSVRLGPDSCSVGIENDSGLVGLEYFRDGQPEPSRLHDSLAVRFYRLQHDVGAEAVLRPAGQVFAGDSVEPLVSVWNTGLSPASFPVRLRIGGYDEQVDVAGLPALADTLVRFPDWVPGPDTYAVELVTGLAGDEYPANDTLRAEVFGSYEGELRYDDGVADAWFLKNGAPTTDWAAAVRFSVPYGQFRLRGARVLVADTLPFGKVIVCPDSSGAPRLGSPYLLAESVAASQPQTWLEVPADVPVSSSDDLWLVAFWPRRAAGPVIGEDRSRPVDGRSYYGSPTVRWFSYSDGDLLARLRIDGRTGIGETAPSRAVPFSVCPNPFRTKTVVSMPATAPGLASITVLDVGGRVVRTLAVSPGRPVSGSVSWDGTDGAGRPLRAGTYIVCVKTATGPLLARVVLLH